MKLKNILFIPVSSPSGIGEYMRSIIIANGLQAHWPKVQIHFILNKQVSYLKQCPYTVHTCTGSPTKDIPRVNAIIEQLTPDLVIFDASGRAKQFKQAKMCGAIVAFISQNKKKRSRGLKINRLLYTDIHWVVQPNFCIKPLTFIQRCKIKLFNKLPPKNVGPVFVPPSLSDQEHVLTKLNLSGEKFFVFTSGSGGTFVDNELAADIFYQAACEFYRQTKIRCVVIFGSSYPHNIYSEVDGVFCLKSLKNEHFISLVNKAYACVVAAGDTLLQCIALNKPCIAGALSSDQKNRLKFCVKNKLVLATSLSQDNICKQALLLVENHSKERLMILNNIKKESDQSGLNLIISDVNRMLLNRGG